MQSNSLRTTHMMASLFLAPFLTAVCSTTSCRAQSGSAITPPGSKAEAGQAGAGQKDDIPGLPSFLLKVPGGKVKAGLEVDAFIKAASEAAFEFNPDQAVKAAKVKLIQNMRRTGASLGRKEVEVETFYLGKWPVKNSEYATFVEAMQKAKIEIRVPYHWWRYGCKDDYEKRLKEIRKEFPKIENPALLYWERHGHELPFKLNDDKGQPIEDHPVTYLNWREANRFAAQLGMRLPTELELTRAMRGDGEHTWPLGEQGKDVYSSDLLKKLGMGKSSDYHTKPVGTVAAATGPYGHLDLFGQVWHFAGDLGYEPLHGDMDDWLKFWKALQKDKVGRLLEKKPLWAVDRAIARCGSYLSYGEPIQLMIDARAPIQTTDVLESLGFRLAKSLQPGFDYIYSLRRVEFNSGMLKKDQKLAMNRTVGGERYDLSDSGFPTAYNAVAFAPTNWLLNDKTRTVKDLIEKTQTTPVLIGALAATANIAEGADTGMYGVAYRAAGITKELRDSVKRGYKELTKELKAASKKKGKAPKKDDKKKKEKKKDGKQGKVTKWRIVVEKFGLTEEDLIDPSAANGDCGFIRIDDVKISTKTDTFILMKDEKAVGYLVGTKRSPTKGKTGPGTLEIKDGGKTHAGKAMAAFVVSVPMKSGDEKKAVIFELNVPLDLPTPSAEKPWRQQ
ncbi:MAG: formylglycine-generating enzyme family protein [Planctomycetota bacterium]